MYERRRFPVVLATAGVVLSLAVLSGCTGGTPANTPGPTDSSSSGDPDPVSSGPASAVEVDPPVRVAVVGDSNSTGHDGDIDSGISDGIAWIAQVGTSDIEYAGGWAIDGATSTRMAQQVKPVDDVDVLVIMAGTNDLAAGISLDALDDDLVSIVGTVKAKNVVIAAIPPISAKGDYAVEANASLKEFADSQGWFFHNGWHDLIGGNGDWSATYKVDGIHTSKAGYGVFGRDMGDFIVSTFAKQ